MEAEWNDSTVGVLPNMEDHTCSICGDWDEILMEVETNLAAEIAYAREQARHRPIALETR